MASSLTLMDDTGTPYEIKAEDIKRGFGVVLQSINYVTSVQASQTVSTTDVIVNGITVSITPVRSNSNFLVAGRWIGEVNSAWDVLFNIHMDGIRVNVVSTRGYGLVAPAQSYVVDDNNSTPETVNVTTLVTQTTKPAGIPVVFSLVADSNSAKTMWTNRCYNASTSSNYERGTSEILVIEIGAD